MHSIFGFSPDVIHANDWQTALCPAYSKVWHWNDARLGRAASVLTLHNVAYQGVYPHDHWDLHRTRRGQLHKDKFESYAGSTCSRAASISPTSSTP